MSALCTSSNFIMVTLKLNSKWRPILTHICWLSTLSTFSQHFCENFYFHFRSSSSDTDNNNNKCTEIHETIISTSNIKRFGRPDLKFWIDNWRTGLDKICIQIDSILTEMERYMQSYSVPQSSSFQYLSSVSFPLFSSSLMTFSSHWPFGSSPQNCIESTDHFGKPARE